MEGIYRFIKNQYMCLAIRRKISLIFTCIFSLFLILLVVIVNALSSKIIIAKTKENFLQNLNLVSGKMDILLDNLENDSKIALINSDVQEILRETKKREATYEEKTAIRKALVSIIEPKKSIETMTVFQTNGNIFETKKFGRKYCTPDVLMTYAEKVGAARNKPYWLDINESLYLRSPMKWDEISFLRAVVDEQTGKSMGIIETSIAEENIKSLYSDILNDNTYHIFIVNRDGDTISHSNQLMLHRNISQQPYFGWIQTNDGVGKTFRVSNEEYLVVEKKNPRVDWYIVGMAPIKEITANGNIFTKTIFLIGFGCNLLEQGASLPCDDFYRKQRQFGVSLSPESLLVIVAGIDKLPSKLEKEKQLWCFAVQNVFDDYFVGRKHYISACDKFGRLVLLQNLRDNTPQQLQATRQLCLEAIESIRAHLDFGITVGMSSLSDGFDHIPALYPSKMTRPPAHPKKIHNGKTDCTNFQTLSPPPKQILAMSKTAQTQ